MSDKEEYAVPCDIMNEFINANFIVCSEDSKHIKVKNSTTYKISERNPEFTIPAGDCVGKEDEDGNKTYVLTVRGDSDRTE
jgi:hypothetical protein